MRNLAPGDHARERQRTAADPSLSAFVAANAGSGKTTVLVERVLRLLLGGVPPGKILCLTYTKAAAAQMAVQVFERLSTWIGLVDGQLIEKLSKLKGRPPTAVELLRARRLFALAVETPGGLKIETIHAFCERVLHLFPFEANVPARFEVLDETAADELLASARAAVMVEAATGRDSRLRDALATASLEAAGMTFDAALAAAVKERNFLLRHHTPGTLRSAMLELARTLGVPAGETLETIERDMIEGGLTPPEWRSIAERLNVGMARDKERADALLEACAAAAQAERLRCYLSVFFTKAQKPRADSNFLTQAIPAALVERLRQERDRLDALAEKRRSAFIVARTTALFTLASAIFRRMEEQKSARGALDFADLIDKTFALLRRVDAAWVLYKLDAGIDHVLVDEAQDTNPAQWEILKALTVDFTAGAGARDNLARSVFAVGDSKQSIFGFQGADPRGLAQTARHFRSAMQGAGKRFEEVSLTVSFRSVSAVLDAVDAVFGLPENFRGLEFDTGAGTIGTVHESTRPLDRGRVEVWPPVRPQAVQEPDAWTLPVDEPDASAPTVVLAERIARAVKRWTTIGDEHGHVSVPGDVLILVRKRGALFEAIIRALKQARVPVAGADRLRLGEHIAVLDLIAAGRAALLPEDDLTMASALKTPLVGLDDEDLVRIGARRPFRQSFASALRQAAEWDPRAAEALRRLEQWRALARRHGPFGFYATLLGPLGARKTLVSRLGAEAGDAIDELLSVALAYERRHTASLAEFLASFGDSIREVKRDMDAARGEVRVMTVHGAKGLEAGTVVIADSCRVDVHRPVLLPVACDGAGIVPAWSARSSDQPQAMNDIRERQKIAEREEHNRLLYVAMTRAKERLVIASHSGKSPVDPPSDCWFAMIQAGLRDRPERVVDAPFIEGDPGERMLLWETGERSAARGRDDPTLEAIDEPPWLRKAVADERELDPPVRPSKAMAAADAAARAPARSGGGSRNMDARLAGTLVHALLEHLPAIPASQRAVAATRFVNARARSLDVGRRERIVRDALAVMADPKLAALFGPASRAEVSVAGALRLPGEHGTLLVSGQIDRLAVTDDSVLLADFKTTPRPPAGIDGVAPQHMLQLAIYEAVLDELFRPKPVRVYLVFTSDGTVLEVAPATLAAARAVLAPGLSQVRPA